MIETIKKSALVQRLPPPAKRVLKRLYYNFFRPPRNSGEVGGSLALSATVMQEVEAAIVHLYQLALLRTPSADERQAWIDELRSQRTNMAMIVECIAKSEEAAQVQERAQSRSQVPDGSLDLSLATLDQVEAAIVHLYQLALLRTPSADERQAWIDELRSQRTNMAMIVECIAKSEEAAQVQERARILPQVPNGRLVQLTYDLILGKGAMAAEILYWDHRLQHQRPERDQFVLSLFVQRIAEQVIEKIPTCDPSVRHVMGTDRILNVKEWQEIAISVPKHSPTPVSKVYPSLRLSLVPGEIVVSAIASLYRGGDFIEQFLENITAQTIFSNTELIIIDADSPEKEFDVISRYMTRFPNIVYHRASTRIGIYEAWNLGVELSKGRYLTNTNLDDLRRVDSFERQVEILEKFQFADVVYQDFYYSFEGDASFERSAATGIRSELPVISPYNLMQSNSPHNAPMWRRSLHGDVGLFDASLRSAGDFEFWLRCCRARKMFYKINDPHVVYFVNPKGVSTGPNTRATDEENRITRQYGRELISEWIVTDEGAFIAELCSRTGESVEVVQDDRTVWDWRYSAVQRALRQLSISSRVRPR